MKSLLLILSLSLVGPAIADDAEVQLGRCTKLSELIETVAKARGDYDGLITAVREIPDMPEVQKFGFDPLFVRKMIMHIEDAHSLRTPTEIRENVERDCPLQAMDKLR